MKKICIFLLGIIYCSGVMSQENETRSFKLNITSNKGKSIAYARFTMSGIQEAIPEKGGIMTFENIPLTDTLELYLGKNIYPIYIEGTDSMAIAINNNNANTINSETGKKENLRKLVSSSNNASEVKNMGDDIRQYNSIAEYLRGKVAGVYVNGETITIRGTNTMFGASGPLFVIDGVAVGGYSIASSSIDPSDIGFVEVLKDGSEYGTRGGGGVIKITTKKVER